MYNKCKLQVNRKRDNAIIVIDTNSVEILDSDFKPLMLKCNDSNIIESNLKYQLRPLASLITIAKGAGYRSWQCAKRDTDNTVIEIGPVNIF